MDCKKKRHFTGIYLSREKLFAMVEFPAPKTVIDEESAIFPRHSRPQGMTTTQSGFSKRCYFPWIIRRPFAYTQLFKRTRVFGFGLSQSLLRPLRWTRVFHHVPSMSKLVEMARLLRESTRKSTHFQQKEISCSLCMRVLMRRDVHKYKFESMSQFLIFEEFLRQQSISVTK